MISILKMEAYKLWHKPNFIALMIIIFCMNLGIFAYLEQSQNIPLHAYQTLQVKLNTLPNEKRYTYICNYDDQIQAFEILSQMQSLKQHKETNQLAVLQSQYPDIEKTYGNDFLQYTPYFTDSLELEAEFMHTIRKEMDTLYHYKAQLQDIRQKADAISSISIFSQKDSFSARNIIKTSHDFEKMSDCIITYQLEKGIKDATHAPITDILILIMMMVIASSMIMEEKSRHLFSIVKTTKRGYLETIISKCIIMSISILCFSSMMYLSNLIYMQIFCGLGNLNASLISLASYSQSTLSITIKQFFFLFFTTKWLVASMIGFFMLMIAVLSSHRLSCFTIILVFLGIEGVCYQYIPANTRWQLLKYLNVFNFLETDNLYQIYRNLNIFQYPLSLQFLSFICMITLLCLGFIACVLAYTKKRNLVLSTNDNLNLLSHHTFALSLWKQECYKLLWVQKGIIFLILFFILQGYTFTSHQTYISQDQRQWISYMKELSGLPSQQKDAFINKQDVYYEQLHHQINELQKQYDMHKISKQELQEMIEPLTQQLYGEETFANIKAQYQYVKEGKNRQMMVPFGYEYLFFQDHANAIPAILALTFLILMLSNFECYEYHQHHDQLIYTTSKGRYHLFKVKLSIALICGLIFTLLAFSFDFYHVYEMYGLSNIQASITSFTYFSTLPEGMSILQFLIIMWCCKLIAIESAVCIIFGLSVKLKQQIYVIFFFTLTVIFPLILYFIGFHFLDGYSLIALFHSAFFIKEQATFYPLYVTLFYILVACISCNYAQRSIKKR